jgi:hypothetical protein
MTITKREILFSVIIIAIMIVSGLFISNAIEKSHMEDAEKYFKALKVEDAKMFEYNKKTHGGNTLAYGNAKVVDSVSVPELKGEYAVIVKHKEMYQKHIEYVTREDDEGNTYTEEVIRYSWDSMGSESFKSKEVLFLEQKLPSEIFHLGSGSRVDLGETVSDEYKEKEHWGYLYEDSHWFENVGDLRWYFTVVPSEFAGSLFVNLNGDAISEKNTSFYYDQTIADVIEMKENSAKSSQILFWVLWIIFLVFVVWMFYYIDNHWLEG